MPDQHAPLVIFGSGGHARELAEVVHARHDAGQGPPLLGFLDDDVARQGLDIDDHPILGGLSWIVEHPTHPVVLGIGSPAIKRRIAERLRSVGARFETLVHPRAEVGRTVSLAPGVVITAGCIVTSRSKLGPHVHVNRLATIGHDCVVGAYVHLAPGTILSGHVTIGEGCDLGTGVRVIPGVCVGVWTTVGAAACITRDLPAHVIAVGVPARVSRPRDPGTASEP